MEYLKEPFDFKLFVLKMLGKWYQFVLCTVIGAVLFGVPYYLYKTVYAPAKEFEATATYYIQYVNDPVVGDTGTYFNEYTLDTWLKQDAFTEIVLDDMKQTVTKQELETYVTVTLPSDIRIFQVKITTVQPDLTIGLLEAYDHAIAEFAQRQSEIHAIECQDKSEQAQQIKADIRTQRAFVLGGVLGLVLGGLCIVLRDLLDDGIYIPATLQKRHKIKVFGSDVSEELKENVKYAVGNCQKIAVTSIGETVDIMKITESFQKEYPTITWTALPAFYQCPEEAEVLRKQDGCILIVEAGKDKSGAIDRALMYYAQQDVKVIGAILWNMDERLLKGYGK